MVNRSAVGRRSKTFGERVFELVERIARDKIKTEYCANNTIPLLRLPWTLTEEEIKNNTNVFINNIMEAW